MAEQMQNKNGRNAARTCAKRAPLNAKSSIWRNRDGFRLDRRSKPPCVAVRQGRSLRLVGVGRAAEWLGISRTTLFNIVSEKGGKDFAAETVALVRREYPGLFKEAK